MKHLVEDLFVKIEEKGDFELKKYSVRVSGHLTSISLEKIFWKKLNVIAIDTDVSINELISKIDNKRIGNLSSAIRVYVFRYFQQ